VPSPIDITLLFRELLGRLSTSKVSLSPGGPYAGEDDSAFTTTLSGEFKVTGRGGLGCSSLLRTVVVDGSSRRLGSPGFRVFLAGVAVYGGVGGSPLMLYPTLSGLEGGVGFMGVKAPIDVLKSIEGDGSLSRFVRVRFTGGGYFDEDANEDDISDDVRMSLEAWAIGELARRLNRGYAVILDGPIYLGVREKANLAFSRITAVNGLEGVGVPVVGVVKRVENSRKLCSGGVIEELNVDVDPRHCNDPTVVQAVGRRFSGGVGDVVLIGPFRHVHGKAGGLTSFMFPERVFWYVHSGFGSRVFRVEALASTYNSFGGEVDCLVKWLALSIDGNGLPYVIDIADRFAKGITRSLYLLFYGMAKSANVAFTYDTEQEAASVMREVANLGGAAWV